MSRWKTILRKARQASWHEWRTRGSQFAFHLGNSVWAQQKRSWFRRDGHWNSLGISSRDSVDWWQQRQQPWLGFTQLNRELLAEWSATHPDVAPLVARADLVLANRYPIFSHPPVEFSHPDRWHRDAILGRVSARECYTKIEYLNPAAVGDSKYVWEPNRCHWIFWLLTAHTLTHDPRYSACYLAWLQDWLQQNVYPFGINYCSSLELAFRNYAWLWGADYFRADLGQHPVLLDQLLHAIWLAGNHLAHTLSHYFAPNTHLIGEAFGLLVTGTLLPEFRESSAWRALGWQILVQEAERQIHSDGTHRELSTGYHLYTTDFYLHAVWLAWLTGQPIPSRILVAADQLSRRLSELEPGSGILPALNDCDGGRLTGFRTVALDARPSLAMADLLRSTRTSHTPVPYPGQAIWGDHLWVANSLQQHSPLSSLSSRVAAVGTNRAVAGERRGLQQEELPEGREQHGGRQQQGGTPATTILPSVRDGERQSGGDSAAAAAALDSGLVSYRSDADDYCLFRCGPFGYLDAGHSHDGQTGLVLHLAGQPVLIDSGCGSYTQSLAARNCFRLATGKNVMLINGRGPSEPDGWFNWSRATSAELLGLVSGPRGLTCWGGYTGYSEVVGFPIQIQRSVTLLDLGICVIIDRWDGREPTEVSLVWNLAPGLQSETDPNRLRTESDEGVWWCGWELASELSATDLPAVGPLVGFNAEHLAAQNWATCSYRWESAECAPDYGLTVPNRRLVLQPAQRSRGLVITAFTRRGPCEWSDVLAALHPQ